ncbi:MAG TPA: hypothetical protein QGH10_09700 [Armatimonadota bacterium]|nr:hypothetical protein [Armatimonadota bacterium]
MRARIGILICVLLALAVTAAAASHGLPKVGETATWEAEDATGWAAVERGEASGGAYATGEGALEYRFSVKQQTTLRVNPVWWRDGEQKHADRFPYPVQAQSGPDKVVVHNGLVFYTAPRTGRVGVVRAESGKPAGYHDIGGYLTDICVDGERNTIIVADAAGDRIVGFPAAGVDSSRD